MSHSSERLSGYDTGSNYWEQGGIHLSAFTNLSWHFRLTYDPSVEEFGYSFRLFAAALRGGVVQEGGFITEKGRRRGGNPRPVMTCPTDLYSHPRNGLGSELESG
jgi:hypothetical protein